MIHALTAEQQELRGSLRKLLGDSAQPRDSFDGGPPVDMSLWRQLAGLGGTGLLIPEDLGGSGGSVFDAVVLAEQAGAFDAPVPVVTPNLAAWLLVNAAGREAATEHAAALASGESVVLAAVSARTGLVTSLQATHGSRGWRVTGTIPDALEASAATALVALAETSGGARMFLMDLSRPGADRADLDSLDPTQRLAHVSFNDAEGTDLGPVAGFLPARCLRLGWTLLASQALGAAATALEITTGYVSDRRQFGQPVGRFQAVKHRLANMLVDVENARSATYNAGWALTDERDDAELAARLAKAVGTENAVRVTESAVQAHGGIGFTWEYDLHLYLRRAKSCELCLGQPDDHFAAIADAIVPGAQPEGVTG